MLLKVFGKTNILKPHRKLISTIAFHYYNTVNCEIKMNIYTEKEIKPTA